MDDRNRKKRLFLRLALLVMLCLIWGNSMLPGDESSELSNGVLAWLRSIGIPFPSEHILRKMAHFTEFALLGCVLTLLLRLRQGPGLQTLSNAAFAALLTALTDETIQYFSPGRSAEVKDVLLDFSGALTGLWLTVLLIFLIGKRKAGDGTR